MSNKYSLRQAPSGRGEVYSRPSATIRRCRIRPRACPFKGILNTGSVDHLPFKGFPPGKPYRLLLGLREPQDPWLDVDEDDELLIDQLQQRAAHMRDRREAVIQLVDEPLARAASWELLEQLMEELPLHHPHRFAVQKSVITNLLTGESFDTAAAGVDPLEVAGRITQEDYCLLAPGGGAAGAGSQAAGAIGAAAGAGTGSGGYRLLGGVVCFPAHWSILEKLGMELPDVHDPVPRWRSDAAPLVERFLGHLTTDRPFIRWNWTLSPTTELHLSSFYSPPPGPTTAPPEDTCGIDFLQLRLERQYFHRLPRTNCLVFTIRTYMQPLRRAVRGRPLVAAALAGALRDLPYEHLQYKSNLQWRMPALLELLDEVAAGGPSAEAPPPAASMAAPDHAFHIHTADTAEMSTA